MYFLILISIVIFITLFFKKSKYKIVNPKDVHPNHLDENGFLKDEYYDYYFHIGFNTFEMKSCAILRSKEYKRQIEYAKKFAKLYHQNKK